MIEQGMPTRRLNYRTLAIEKVATKLFVEGYSDCMLGGSNWMTDVFSSNFSDLSNHKGTLFLHRSLSNPGKKNDSLFCVLFILLPGGDTIRSS